jgi:mono/diheme cytochrome c family protein
MPVYEGKLSDEEIWAVLAYIKSRWPEKIQQRQENLNGRAKGS